MVLARSILAWSLLSALTFGLMTLRPSTPSSWLWSSGEFGAKAQDLEGSRSPSGCRVPPTRALDYFQTKIGSIELNKSKKLARHFSWLCKKHGLDPAFVVAVIEVESSFNPKAISSAGAIGLMQLMPDTARHVLQQRKERWGGESLKERLKDPFFNLSLGTAYLAELKERYRGNLDYSLVAYNAGPKRMDDVLSGLKRPLSQALDYVKMIRVAQSLQRPSPSVDCNGPGQMQLTRDIGV